MGYSKRPKNMVVSAEVVPSAHVSFSPDEQFVGVAMDTKFFVLKADTGEVLGRKSGPYIADPGHPMGDGRLFGRSGKIPAIVGALKRLVASGSWRATNSRQLLLTWSGDGLRDYGTGKTALKSYVWVIPPQLILLGSIRKVHVS